MPVTHKIDSESKTITISISGQFDFSAHPEFRASYKDIEDKSYTIIVDLKNTEGMDSAALGMLLLLDENFPDNRVKLINANDFVTQVLEIAHFNQKFDIG